MKKMIIAALITLAMSASGCKQISKITESLDMASFTDEENQSPDYKLVRAFVGSDTETIDKILASGDKGEIIDLIKSYEPKLKIRSYEDIGRAACIIDFSCDEDAMTKENLDSCANARASVMNHELKTYPSCEKEIREFYTVAGLCMLGNSVCGKDDTELLLKDPETRNKGLMERSQNSYNCLRSYMKNINAKTECIANTPRSSQAELDKQLKLYCDQAVSCKVVKDLSTCMNKYKSMFKNDKRSHRDCTDVHLNYMTPEFLLMNTQLKIIKEYSNHLCEVIDDYEKAIHNEELFDQSSDVHEYNRKYLEITNKDRENYSNPLYKNSYTNFYTSLSWQKYYITSELNSVIFEKLGKNEYDELNNEINDLISEKNQAMTYYSACRISNLGAK